jgi:hypothetical protein
MRSVKWAESRETARSRRVWPRGADQKPWRSGEYRRHKAFELDINAEHVVRGLGEGDDRFG